MVETVMTNMVLNKKDLPLTQTGQHTSGTKVLSIGGGHGGGSSGQLDISQSVVPLRHVHVVQESDCTVCPWRRTSPR